MNAVPSSIPVLRILVPFVMGIALHRLWHCWWAPVALLIVSAAFYLTLEIFARTPARRLRWRHYFILPLATGALALGWIAAVIHCPPHLTTEQRSGRILTGMVTDLSFTDFSTRLTIELTDKELPPCRVFVSTRGCDYTIQTGDVVAWQAHLDEVGKMGNPDEMDYARYLLDSKGIRYQQHLPVSQLRIIGHRSSFKTRMAEVRRGLQSMVFNSSLSPGAQQFVVALLLGDSSLIDKATRQEFSAAGVAHVLALSGLHVGFIALIIWWLLFPLDYLRLKKLRLAITIAAIALFAVFTGLSPSVIRATIMIGMVFVSILFYRRSVSLNALGIAALAILIFTPSALYQVGFQLSFITVAAVLILARLPESLKSRSKICDYLTSTVITTLVALLSTVALTAHYFHTISFLSVISNLLILPVLPVFMVLGALFLLITAAGMHWTFLDSSVEAVYRYIRWATGAVNGLPLSHVNGVYVSTFGVVAYFAIMTLVVIWLYRREFRYLLAAGAVLVLLLSHSVWVDANTPKQGVVIFNSFSSTPILYYSGDTGYVWSPDDEELDSAAFSRYYAGFLARHNIDELHFITSGDSLRLDGAMFNPPYAHLMGRRIMAAGSGKWKRMHTDNPLALDDLIVTKRYHGTAAKLKELYGFKRLVLSGALHDAAPLRSECDSLQIPYHDLANQGALIVP